MLLVDQPVIYPAVTLQGRAAGPVVDTGCELLAGGRVYIDRTEGGEIARLFGFATPDQVRQYTERIAVLEEQLDAALGQVATVRRAVAEAVGV